MVGKNLSQPKNDYGEDAGIIYGLFLASIVKYCNVIINFGVLSQKITFKGFNQNIINLKYKDFLDLERSETIKNISKLKWK